MCFSFYLLYFYILKFLHTCCQSSGKSSVLESIVGRDFLPRGSGLNSLTFVLILDN
jgi:Dynamin family